MASQASSNFQGQPMLVKIVAGPSSNGAAIPSKQRSSTVSLVNLHQWLPIEFKCNGGSWQRLDGGCGIAIDANLAVDVVRVRRVAIEGGEVQVGVQVERSSDALLVQGPSQLGNSIMFIGSSTYAAGSALPNLPETSGVRLVSPVLTAMNAQGQFIGRTLMAAAAPQAAGGVLKYNIADATLTWQAPGDSEGPRVAVSAAHMWYTLPSGSPGLELYCETIPRLAPLADVSVTFPAPLATLSRYDNVSSFGLSGWIQLLTGTPFTRTISFAKASAALSDMRAAHADWENVYADVTHIYMGTNDVGTRAQAARALEDMEFIVKLRLALGSKVYAGCILPMTGRTAAQLQAVAEFNLGLRAMGERLGFVVWDAWPYVAASSGDWVAGFSYDGTHMTPATTYLVAKRAVLPAMKGLARAVTPSVPAMVAYDEVLAPYGNLLPNAVMAGTSGAPGAGVSGTIPANWVIEREVGTTITAVCTAPDSAGATPLSDGRQGKYFTVAINNTNAGNVAGESIRLRRPGGALAGIAPGDLVVLEGEIRLQGSGVRSVAVSLSETATPSTTVYAIQGLGDTGGLGNLDGDAVRLPFRTTPFRLSATMTTVQLFISVALQAGGIATLDIAPTLNFHKVPEL